MDVRVPVWHPSPRRGQGASPGRKVSSPRQRVCSSRRRGALRCEFLRLGELEDRKCGASSSLRRGCCSSRRRYAMPKLGCDCVRLVFMTLFGVGLLA